MKVLIQIKGLWYPGIISDKGDEVYCDNGKVVKIKKHNISYHLTTITRNKSVAKVPKYTNIERLANGGKSSSILRKYKDYIESYNRGKTKVSNDEFDFLEDVLLLRGLIKERHIGTISKTKVKLPFFMGSMDKRKSVQALLDYQQEYQGPYVISGKLDGISVGIDCYKGTYKLYTRGRDGIYGLDISYMIPFLDLPQTEKTFQARGELMMSLSTFKKYRDEFENPRNLVGGVTTRISIHPALKAHHIQLIAYELICPRYNQSKQFAKLKQLGFDVVVHKELKSLDYSDLTSLLKSLKKRDYEYDGIIISDDKKHKPINGNPTWAFAFKSMEALERKTVEVTGVTWKASRYNYAKPTVQIKPVRICGVTVTNLTAHNAAHIYNNDIGKGTILEIVRSGDVIPYIDKVVKSTKAEMPRGNWEWTDTEVDIIYTDKNEVQQIRNMVYFFSTLGVENLKYGTVSALYYEGYNTLTKIYKAKKKDLLQIDGFGKSKVDAILKLPKELDIDKVVVGSGVLGRGISTIVIDSLLDVYPDAFFNEVTWNKKVDNWGKVRQELYTKNFDVLQKFLRSLQRVGITYKKPSSVDVIDSEFKNIVVYLTGVRDSNIYNYVTQHGGKIANSLTKQVNLLIYKDGVSNNKTQSFKGNKMTHTEFITKYLE